MFLSLLQKSKEVILIKDYFALSTSSFNQYVMAYSFLPDYVSFEKCWLCEEENFVFRDNITLVIEKPEKKWGDFILCGEWPIKVVSKRFIQILEDENFKDYETYPVHFVDTEGRKIVTEQLYYILNAKAIVSMDYEQMGIKVERCKICGNHKFSKNTWEFGDVILKDTDVFPLIFKLSDFNFVLYCNMDMLKKIGDYKLKNIKIAKGSDEFKVIHDYYKVSDIKRLIEDKK